MEVVEENENFIRTLVEKGLTEAQLHRVKMNAETNAKNDAKQRRRHYATMRLRNSLEKGRYLYDEWSYIFVRDLAMPWADKNLGCLDPVMSVLLLYTALIMFGAYLFGRICGLFPMIGYTVIICSDPDPDTYVLKFLAFVWLVTKVVKVFGRKPEQHISPLIMSSPGRATDWYAVSGFLKFYLDVGLMVGGVYFFYGRGYAQVGQGVMFVYTVMVLARNIPGVGGNSTGGMLALALAILLASCVMPEVLSKMFEIVSRHTAAKPMKSGLGPGPLLAHTILLIFLRHT